MSNYYKIVKNLDVNLKPYIVTPMYDENPDLGVYHSTLGVPHPQKDDYLIYENGNVTFSSAYRDFDEVSFKHKANIEDLFKKEIIHEVSFEVYSLDIELANSIKEIYEKIDCSESGLEFMKDDRENYSEKDIKKEQDKLTYLKKQLKNLQDKQAELSKDWIKKDINEMGIHMSNEKESNVYAGNYVYGSDSICDDYISKIQKLEKELFPLQEELMTTNNHKGLEDVKSKVLSLQASLSDLDFLLEGRINSLENTKDITSKNIEEKSSELENKTKEQQSAIVSELDFGISKYNNQCTCNGTIKIGDKAYEFAQSDISGEFFIASDNDLNLSQEDIHDMIFDAVDIYVFELDNESRCPLSFSDWSDTLQPTERPEYLESIISKDMLPDGLTDVNLFIDSFMKDEYKNYVGEKIKDIYSAREPGIKYMDIDIAFKLNEINQGFNRTLRFKEIKQFCNQLNESKLGENKFGEYLINHCKEVVKGIDKCNLMLEKEQTKKAEFEKTEGKVSIKDKINRAKEKSKEIGESSKGNRTEKSQENTIG